MKIFLLILISLNIFTVGGINKSYAAQHSLNVQLPLNAKAQSQKQALDNVVIQQYKWQAAIPSSGKVKVINRFGSISIKNINQPIVAVTGAMQLIGETPAQATVISTQADGVQIIEVTYPEGNTDKFGHKRGRVDLGVFVPKGVSLTLITDFGDIKSRKLKSNVIAKTNSGKIKIGSNSTIQASTNTGDIKLTIQKNNSKQARFIESTKTRFNTLTSKVGNIQVYLQDNVNVSLSANSKNSIKNNLRVNNSTKISANTKQLFSAVLGKGTRHYEIKSQAGAINIHRSEWHKMQPTIKTQQVASP